MRSAPQPSALIQLGARVTTDRPEQLSPNVVSVNPIPLSSFRHHEAGGPTRSLTDIKAAVDRAGRASVSIPMMAFSLLVSSSQAFVVPGRSAAAAAALRPMPRLAVPVMTGSPEADEPDSSESYSVDWDSALQMELKRRAEGKAAYACFIVFKFPYADPCPLDSADTHRPLRPLCADGAPRVGSQCQRRSSAKSACSVRWMRRSLRSRTPSIRAREQPHSNARIDCHEEMLIAQHEIISGGLAQSIFFSFACPTRSFYRSDWKVWLGVLLLLSVLTAVLSHSPSGADGMYSV